MVVRVMLLKKGRKGGKFSRELPKLRPIQYLTIRYIHDPGIYGRYLGNHN